MPRKNKETKYLNARFSLRSFVLYFLLLLGFILQTLYLLALPNLPILETLIWVTEGFGILIWLLALQGQLGNWSAWIRAGSIETGLAYAKYSEKFALWLLLPWLSILASYPTQNNGETMIWLGLIALTLLSILVYFWQTERSVKIYLLNLSLPFAVLTLGHIITISFSGVIYSWGRSLSFF